MVACSTKALGRPAGDHDLSRSDIRGAWTGWRSALSPAGTRSNIIAWRFFVAAGLMVLGGIVLALAAMLLGLESTEWAFIIVFWFGIVLAVSAFVAILMTRPGAGDDHKPDGGNFGFGLTQLSDASVKHAWILLSIPSRGAAIKEITMRAVFLNNGEPTEFELQESLQWLSAAGLISAEGELFLPTSAGEQLVNEEWRRESMLDTWSAIGLRLEKMTAPNSGTLRAYFDDCEEVRMGSRFQACRLRLEGSWIPPVPNDEDWQNLSATSPDGRFVALVRWDVGGNEPGFRILTVDCRDRAVQTTERILGCCESVAWRDGVFVPTIWHPPANENL
jgi:hypothetical protein